MAKEKILDEDLNLCPEELPEGLALWVRREILSKDATLLYRKGNIRGLCYVCGEEVRATRERFKADFYVNCPNCGARVRCVLSTGTRWLSDYVDNIAAAQMGEDGKTVFIRQWHVLRDPRARFERIEDWLQEYGRYAIRGEAVAKWLHEVKDTWGYYNHLRYRTDAWERNAQFSRIYDGNYTFYIPSIAPTVAGTPLQYKAIEKYAGEVRNANIIRYMVDAARYPVLEFFVKNGY
ncbi:MAG: hypothetical protein IKZ30_06315, partial [Oscillospiraceae bacterium]|nr:hypothetical protein [Oscillospiraceae bacterium]